MTVPKDGLNPAWMRLLFDSKHVQFSLFVYNQCSPTTPYNLLLKTAF